MALLICLGESAASGRSEGSIMAPNDCRLGRVTMTGYEREWGEKTLKERVEKGGRREEKVENEDLVKEGGERRKDLKEWSLSGILRGEGTE